MKLTDTAIKNLKSKEAKYFIHGDMSNGRHGFAICVYPASLKYPSGTKSWFFIYRFEGKRCFLPLGKYPIMSLAEACLTEIDELRDKHGRIDSEPRHPDIASDRPWPLVAGYAGGRCLLCSY